MFLTQKNRKEKVNFVFLGGGLLSILIFTLTLYEHILHLRYKCVCIHMLSLSVDDLGSVSVFFLAFLVESPKKLKDVMTDN